MRTSSLVALTTLVASCGPVKHLSATSVTPQVRGVTQGRFERTINEIVSLYQPLAQEFGATLRNASDWDDPAIDPFAGAHGNQWRIEIQGGYGRYQVATVEALAVLTCHEIGHLFGGYPAVQVDGWSATNAFEGQADYFAAHACLKKLWRERTAENHEIASGAPALVTQRCASVWRNADDAALCSRIALAGKDFAQVDAALHPGATAPSFETADRSVVSETQRAWPASQCRLDTLVNGALCDVAWDDHQIPASEAASLRHTCSETNRPIGKRPSCWFKQQGR